MNAWFDFNGLLVEVSSPEPVLGEVRRDFSFFERPPNLGAPPSGSIQVHIRMHLEPPRYKGLPATPAAVLTPRNVSFLDGRTSYIDYFGRGLAVYDREAENCDVYSDDAHLLREIVYLFVLSTVGRYLDSKGLHRLHALGVSYQDRAILLLLPSGGGKSTMALALLNRPGFQLLGEDTPLIDRRGHVLPFQLPLGIRLGGSRAEIPEQYLRVVERMEFEPKALVDLAYFGDRIGRDVTLPGVLLIGQRNLGEISEIVPVSRLGAVGPLIKNLVVGLGVYQGLEFLLERSVWEAFGKIGVGLSRVYNGLRLLMKARAYRFVLGRDMELNQRTLLEFVERKYGGPEGSEPREPGRA